ncbi:uncharacterized protein [Antedon mediterranea]|uniref:uncharacterized protein isoform X2 n=1 Tax=Antedon mediterranea TaxID=105859 RepID=UPI003AF9B12A
MRYINYYYYIYLQYDPDIEEPVVSSVSSSSTSGDRRTVNFYLSIPAYQNRSYTLVPEWKSPELDSSNLRITSISKSDNFGQNIPCVDREITEGIPGRSVMMGRMINSGYVTNNGNYNKMRISVTVEHNMCNLHPSGSNVFYIHAHYSPTQSVKAQSSFTYNPDPSPEIPEIPTPDPYPLECSPTPDVLMFSNVTCRIILLLRESRTSVSVEVRLRESASEPILFHFVQETFDVHTIGDGLDINDTISFNVDPDEDGSANKKLVIEIGPVNKLEFAPTCPENWLLGGSKCYAYVGESSVYSDAVGMCEQYSSTLVIVESYEENMFVQLVNGTEQLVNETEQLVNVTDNVVYIEFEGMWLGLSDSSVEGEWRWISAKDDSVYSNWKSIKTCDSTKNCAFMDINGTWVSRSCDEGLTMNVVCEQGATFTSSERFQMSLNFSFRPYSIGDFIIEATVDQDGILENTDAAEISVFRPEAARAELMLTYAFDSSLSYTVQSLIEIHFTLKPTMQSAITAANVYIMFYLPKLFNYVSANCSETVIPTNYGVKILTSNIFPGEEPLQFKVTFSVSSDVSLFKEKNICKGTIFVSTVYNQTYFEGSEYAENHLFEIKNLITIDVTHPDLGLVPRCTSPVALGMESGRIKDCQITSSEAPDEDAPAHNARLNMTNTAWKIYRKHELDNHDSWLAIDLLYKATITSIATQGGLRVGTLHDFQGSIGSFQLLYGTKKGVYKVALPRIQSDPNNKTYFEHGILDPSIVKHHSLLPAVDARYVMFKLERYCLHHFASMRVELFGCYYDDFNDTDCTVSNSFQSGLGEQSRGFMVVDDQLFVCDSLPSKLEYSDDAFGNRLYYNFTRNNMLGSYCMKKRFDEQTWSRLPPDVSMLLGYDSESFHLYGTKISDTSGTAVRSIDNGRSWHVMMSWMYAEIRDSSTFVSITNVPVKAEDDFNWLNQSNILNNYIIGNIGASYDGIYTNVNGDWQRLLNWKQCCLQSTANYTQPCV